VCSAGIEAHGLNPNALQVKQEVEVDITGQKSQRLDEIDTTALDLVVSVCGHADKNCPVLPVSCRKLHAPFDDPPALAREAANEDAASQHYRRVRVEIRAFVERLPELLATES